MDLESLKFGFQVLQFLLTGGIGVYVYLTNKDKVTNDRISRLEEDIDTKLDTQGERIATLEANAKNAPTHNDLASLHEKINGVANNVSSMIGEMKGVSENLRLLLGQITARGINDNRP